ncbi:hypothetical protein QF024_001851 [Chryseobacterium nepalense]|nr:hypothetical protein [Chryseobacterium nepalense]
MIYIRVVILNGAKRNENALANETFSNFIFPNLTSFKNLLGFNFINSTN